jgi:hypothetical protein
MLTDLPERTHLESLYISPSNPLLAKDIEE